MPNLSKTMLNEEIDYAMDNYKINESSRDDNTGSSDKIEQSMNKSNGIRNYK